MQKINTIAVLGAGQMGTGIAQVCIAAGYSVILVDQASNALATAERKIRLGLKKWSEKNLIEKRFYQTPDLTLSNELKTCAVADVVIEAITEDKNHKLNLFSTLSEICKTETILCSNTSSISIAAIAKKTLIPQRVIGMHFFNPVPAMSLVEIIPTEQTDQETIELISELSVALGKTPISVKDSPGFISNRILMPMINEAIACLDEGIASPEGIDQIMTLGMAHPMGPLELADLIGLDTCESILQVLANGLKNDHYRPHPLLTKKVSSGELGKKSGRGFYQYPDNAERQIN